MLSGTLSRNPIVSTWLFFLFQTIFDVAWHTYTCKMVVCDVEFTPSHDTHLGGAGLVVYTFTHYILFCPAAICDHG